MKLSRGTQILARHFTTVMWFAVFGILLGVGLSFLHPMEHRASIRLLVTQDSISADAYTASRSAERVADELVSVLHSSAFFDSVMGANFNIDEAQFSDDDSRRRKAWENMLDASVQRRTGLLSVDVYNEDPAQGEQISQAVAFVLSQQGWRYTSGGNVSIRLIDEPLVSKYPVRPNISYNGFLGLVIGFFVGAGFVTLRYEAIERRRVAMHR